MQRCPSCGEENSDRARFCQACATPLTPAAETRESRKVVTVLFADVKGSTALGERLDPEALRRVMSRFFDETAAVIERHGGTVEKFIGDAVMAVFGIPQLHEDDALRAVRAAMDMKAALAAFNAGMERDHGAGLQTRTGINTGEVVAGDSSGGQRLVTGDAVNVAARLEQSAEPGQILIGESTYRLVRDAVTASPVTPLDLKGKSQPVPAFALTGVHEGIEGHARHLDSVMVGRAKELELLEGALERAASERRSNLFTVLGPAGVGKSRLVHEFLARRRAEGTAVLRGRCLSYGEGITFFPLAEIVHAVAGIGSLEAPEAALAKLAAILDGADRADRIAALIAGLFGWTTPGSNEEAFWAVRKLFEHIARDRTTVVVFDDIHWAEPTFLDLIEFIADWARDAALLIVCLARPELLDVRRDWGGGKMNATTILLEPLGGEEASQLLDNLLGNAEIPGVVRERILEAAEGNPLFVEEMLAMLIDDGLLRFENGRWRPAGDLRDIVVPPTIQLLLAARLDRLDGEERAVIERGAVEGKVFHAGAVATLTPEASRPRVPSRLLALARKELVRPDRAEFPGEDAFRFRHLLIRDAAYNAMPKEHRADLHERFAEWLERVAGDRVAEYEEILGHHLEQAYRYRREIGATDDQTAEIRHRAGLRLLSSARRASSRGDTRSMRTLAERAAGLLDSSERAFALRLLAEALENAAEYQAAFRTASDARAAAAEAGDRGGELRGFILATTIRGQIDPGWRIADVIEDLRLILAELEAMGDDEGVTQALSRVGRELFYLGRAGESFAFSERLLPRIRELDDPQQRRILMGFLSAAYFGPIEVTRGFELFESLRDSVPQTLQTEALLLVARGSLLALAGRFSEAREVVEKGLAIIDDVEPDARRTRWGQIRAEVEIYAGAYEEAEMMLRDAHAAYEEVGETGYNSTITALLALVLCRLGRFDEAETFVRKSREMTAEDDVASQNAWRVAEALVLSHRGLHEEALRVADEAIAIMDRSDYLPWQAQSLEIRGEVLAAAGRRADAAAAYGDALTLFERKGAAGPAERVRRALAAL